MSKQTYSKYIEPAWRMFKQIAPNRTEEDFVYLLEKHMFVLTAECTPSQLCGEVCWQRDSGAVCLRAMFLYQYRNMQHFFLSPGVADFCVSCVKEFTDDFHKALPVCESVEAPIHMLMGTAKHTLGMALEKGIPEYDFTKMKGGFALHFPTKERTRSIICIPDYMAHTMGPMAYHYLFAATDGDDVVLGQPNRLNQGMSKECEWMMKLIYGLSLYMDAFPDAVVKTQEGDIHQIKQYSGSKNIVVVNDIIREESSNRRSPHWRRGHFRLLSSEKFVHKKGMTVYIRGTFINGSAAFDVLDDTPKVI